MKVKLLDQTHPSADHNHLSRLRSLYEGGELWREHLTFWLPKNSNEPGDVYSERKSKAVYHNYAGSIVSMFAAFLFKDEARIEGESEYLGKLTESADAGSTSWSQFWRERFIDALVEGRSWVWINAPERGDVEVVSLAEEEQMGLRDLYLVPLDACEVLDWGEDRTGNVTWVVFKQEFHRRESVDEMRKKVIQWTRVDATSIQRWEWIEKPNQHEPNPDDEAMPLPPVSHGMGFVPVCRLELPDHLWVMKSLHDPAVACLRGRNALSWALHKTAYAMPVIKRKWDENDPITGPGYYIALGQEDSFEWSEPAGTSYSILQEDVKDLRDELYRVVNQIAMSADASSRMRQSGESKQADWKAVNVVLAAMADLALDTMNDALGKLLRARRDGAEASVIGLEGWKEVDPLEFMEAAAMAVDAHEMSPTFRKSVAKAEAARVLGDNASDEEMQTINDEIDGFDLESIPLGSAKLDGGADVEVSGDPGQAKPPVDEDGED